MSLLAATVVAAPSSASADGSREEGLRLLHLKGCRACHSIDGRSGVGPTFRGLFGSEVRVRRHRADRLTIVDEAHLRRAIERPDEEVREGFPAGVMPVVQLSETEHQQVAAALRALALAPPADGERGVDFASILLVTMGLMSAGAWYVGRRFAGAKPES